MAPVIPASPQFELVNTFLGHKKAINSLAFTLDQRFLLSGGDDGILLIWDNTGKLHQTIDLVFHGPVTSAAWTYSGDIQMPSGIVIGCSNGMVHFFRMDRVTSNFLFVTTERSSPDFQEVVEIVFDPHHSRVATAAMGDVVVWKLEVDGTLAELKSLTRPGELVSSMSSIIAYYVLHASDLQFSISFQVETGAVLWHYALPKRIGSAIMLPDSEFAFTNLMTGVDVFNFPPTQSIQTYTYPISRNVRLQLATIWDGQVLISGSDDGQLRVIHRTAGNAVKSTLPHGTGVTPVLTVSELNDTALVASASSEAPFAIKVWRTTRGVNQIDGDMARARSISTSLTLRQLGLIAILFCSIQAITSRLSIDTLRDYMATSSTPLPIYDILTRLPSEARVKAPKDAPSLSTGAETSRLSLDAMNNMVPSSTPIPNHDTLTRLASEARVKMPELDASGSLQTGAARVEFYMRDSDSWMEELL
ncbi:hypothetical protein NMY22_g6530 [Coprinellus aureogranulatus]|nr:hypothetical protein NMY22_g6530 [Coprinellus aureogranulatus]